MLHRGQYMIRLITREHTSEAFSIIQNVITKMNQWDDIYPDKDVIVNDINNCHAYGYYDSNTLCGFVAINEQFPIEYNSIKWAGLSGKSIYLHRLSVKADCQGKGLQNCLCILQKI